MSSSFLLRICSRLLRALARRCHQLHVFVHPRRFWSLLLAAVRLLGFKLPPTSRPKPDSHTLKQHPPQTPALIFASSTPSATPSATPRHSPPPDVHRDEDSVSSSPSSRSTRSSVRWPSPGPPWPPLPDSDEDSAIRLEQGIRRDSGSTRSSRRSSPVRISPPGTITPPGGNSRRRVHWPADMGSNKSSENRSLSPTIPPQPPLLVPITPRRTWRYPQVGGRPMPASLAYQDIMQSIRPLSLSIDKDVVMTPIGWKQCVHPQGLPYYFKELDNRTYITDGNALDIDHFPDLQPFIHQLENLISEHIDELPDGPSTSLHIYLEPYHDNPTEWGYYIIDPNPSCRSVFWLHELDLGSFEDSIGRPRASDLKNFLESEYWAHCMFFPHCIKASDDNLSELSAILVHSVVDSIRSPDLAMAAFNPANLQQLLSVVDQMKRDILSETAKPYIVCAVAGLMLKISDVRRTLYYGGPDALTTRTISPPTRTILIKIFSPVLFSAPDRYLRQLQIVDPNDFAIKQAWPQFIAGIEKPWSDSTLYATVILAVNLSYLAVPDIDGSNDVSGGQIASLCSTILSIGCILVGLLLVSEDHTDPKGVGDSSRLYFLHLRSNRFGYEPLAILYSLPYALLMWSLVTFVIAIGYFCFKISDVQRIITAVPAAIVVLLVSWEISVHWKSSSGLTGTLLQRIRWRFSFLMYCVKNPEYVKQAIRRTFGRHDDNFGFPNF